MTDRTESPDALPPLRETTAALRRAAIRARKRAQETGTRLVISKNHVVTYVDVAATKPKAERRRGAQPGKP